MDLFAAANHALTGAVTLGAIRAAVVITELRTRVEMLSQENSGTARQLTEIGGTLSRLDKKVAEILAFERGRQAAAAKPETAD